MDRPPSALGARPRGPIARAGLLLGAVAGAIALVIGIGSRNVGLAVTSACAPSTSPLGYTVNVCVTVQDGNLTGLVPVTATVTRGPNAKNIQRVIFLIDATAG